MSELKPLGSEKLNGDEKLKRILELTYYKNNKKVNESKAELVKESKNGGVYGIVREKDSYYVKQGLNESSLDYIGGMYMKNKNRFSSYAEAYKRMEYIKGQEELQEEVKYRLNVPKPVPAQSEAPAPAPEMDAVPPAPAAPDAPEMGGEQPAPEMGGDMGGEQPAPEMGDDMGGEQPAPEMGDDSKPEGDMGGDQEDGGSKRSDYMSEVQKYAGKLGQELRDLHDTMESDDIKYVLNMVISAVQLDKLSDEDIEDIGKKFERNFNQGDQGGMDDSEESDDTSSEEPSGEEDLTEYDAMGALDEFINSSVEDTNETSLHSYSDELAEKKKPSSERPPIGSHGETHLEEDEISLDEIKKEIHRSIGQTLSKYFK
jgi:hypothetical protein